MRHFLLGLFLVALLPLSVSAAGPASSKIPMVAVMPFTGRTLDSDALETIAATLATDLLNTGTFRVMERSQMASILKEQGFQQSGACDGSECAVEVGKLLSVDDMVVGTVGKVGGTYVMNARLVSVQTGEVLRSTSRTSRAEVDAIVTDLLPQLAQDLSVAKSAPSANHAATSSGTTVTGAAGTFTDARDGQVYKYVKIGSQMWMAQNLNYAGVGVCYDNSPSNCATYGRLYTWSEVMAGASSSTSVPSGVQGICPSAWHVPSDAEWSTLVRFVDSATAGTKLKSTSGWSGSGNGTNAYGFNVLPAGARYNKRTFFGLGGYYADFWSSSENDAPNAWSRFFYYYDAYVNRYSINKSDGFSLRCVNDN